MSKYFIKNDWLFGLTCPEYETHTFGYKTGELRLVQEADKYTPLEYIDGYMYKENMKVCTFRGPEDIKLVRYLNTLHFFFVGTYSNVKCMAKDFTEIKLRSDMPVVLAQKEDYDAMMDIKSRVFDYSTYQLDPLFPNELTSKRNVLRLKSYFNNPNHRAYVIKHNDIVVGYLQFVLDGNVAHCVNGAVDPDYHGLFVGATLYSSAFKNIFKLGVNYITSGYCNQNMPALKLHQSCNFKLLSHEIHLRLKI